MTDSISENGADARVPGGVEGAPLTPDDVATVAGLAMLELTAEELQTFTGQLAAVLEHARDVEALDVDDVPPTHHPFPLLNVMRPDEPATTGLATDPEVRSAVLDAAPATEDGQFRVPPALGEEP